VSANDSSNASAGAEFYVSLASLAERTNGSAPTCSLPYATTLYPIRRRLFPSSLRRLWSGS